MPYADRVGKEIHVEGYGQEDEDPVQNRVIVLCVRSGSDRHSLLENPQQCDYGSHQHPRDDKEAAEPAAWIVIVRHVVKRT